MKSYYTNIMQVFTKLLRIFTLKSPPLKLGRWNIENCDKKVKYKVDLSNRDHCGPCGNYDIQHTEISKKNTSKL